MSFATSPGFVWLAGAVVLVIMEVLSGTFYLLAMAVGFAAGAVAFWLGASLPAQIMVAAITALFAAIALRFWKKTHVDSIPTDLGADFGQPVTVLDWKSENTVRVQYRGTQWNAVLAPGAQSGLGTYVIHSINGSELVLTDRNTAEVRHG